MKLNELEVKLALTVEQFQSVFELCQKLFGKPISHTLQLDEYYDTEDRQLNQQDLVIRIRSQGIRKQIALKSPRIKLPSGLTNRIELEFQSAAEENVHEQLLHQGLKPFEASEKERWTFVTDDFEIVLDKLPFIGTFIEIEGPSEEAIHSMLQKLHLSSDQIVTQNYGEIMKDKLKALQLPLVSATFAGESEFYASKRATKSIFQ